MKGEQNRVPSTSELSAEEKYQKFLNIVKNEPLIEAVPSLEGITQETILRNAEGSIYYGTGLTTPRAVAVGLPFDVLGMILTAERVRRSLGYKTIYHHIADTHATTNKWISTKQVSERAIVVKDALEKVASNLNLDALKIVISSSFDKSPEYLQMLAPFAEQSQEHEYVVREMADMDWYRTKYDVAIKMGWIIQGSETTMGFDERRFDREYVRIRGKLLSFIYTKPGRTFDRSRPKASPYIQVEGENRLLLEKGESVKKKFDLAFQSTGDPHFGGARKHIEEIVRIYEKLFDPLGKLPFEDKVQAIIDKATG